MEYGVLIFVGFLVLLVLLAFNPFYIIKEVEVGLVEKKILGGTLRSGRVVASNGEQGLQARILPPGLHFLPRPFYKVTRIRIIEVPQGQIATVTAIDGAPLRTGQLLGKTVPGHQSFQDGEAFLR